MLGSARARYRLSMTRLPLVESSKMGMWRMILSRDSSSNGRVRLEARDTTVRALTVVELQLQEWRDGGVQQLRVNVVHDVEHVLARVVEAWDVCGACGTAH